MKQLLVMALMLRVWFCTVRPTENGCKDVLSGVMMSYSDGVGLGPSHILVRQDHKQGWLLRVPLEQIIRTEWVEVRR